MFLYELLIFRRVRKIANSVCYLRNNGQTVRHRLSVRVEQLGYH